MTRYTQISRIKLDYYFSRLHDLVKKGSYVATRHLNELHTLFIKSPLIEPTSLRQVPINPSIELKLGEISLFLSGF